MSIGKARALRKNPTDAGARLWPRLRRRQLHGCRFRRQVPLGPYIADFVCYEARLTIEVDGGQHAEGADSDHRRTAWLESQGFRVLRFWNADVLSNLDGVVDAIRAALGDAPPPHPSPTRGEGDGG